MANFIRLTLASHFGLIEPTAVECHCDEFTTWVYIIMSSYPMHHWRAHIDLHALGHGSMIRGPARPQVTQPDRLVFISLWLMIRIHYFFFLWLIVNWYHASLRLLILYWHSRVTFNKSVSNSWHDYFFLSFPVYDFSLFYISKKNAHQW